MLEKKKKIFYHCLTFLVIKNLKKRERKKENQPGKRFCIHLVLLEGGVPNFAPVWSINKG